MFADNENAVGRCIFRIRVVYNHTYNLLILINIKDGDSIAAVSVVNKSEEEQSEAPAEGQAPESVEQTNE